MLPQVSNEALNLYQSSDVIDLHVDSFIWTRIFGYDLKKNHSHRFGGNFGSHVDFPRALEAGLTGATWVISTNPLRSGPGRVRTFLKNVEAIQKVFASASDQFQIVRTSHEYQEARRMGKHGAFIGIQGGNCVDSDFTALDRIPDRLLLRITVIHLLNSRLGETSTPSLFGRKRGGLTSLGKDFVEKLNEKKIFVDLSHASEKAFFDAAEVHDPSQPLLVSHTGIGGVYDYWRNLTDRQIKTVADTGGVIGIMFQKSFLSKEKAKWTIETLVDHMEHVIKVAGEDHVAIGSDFDGMIMPPPGLESCLGLPKLVQVMLERNWKPERVTKILGGNFLRSLKLLRG